MSFISYFKEERLLYIHIWPFHLELKALDSGMFALRSTNTERSTILLGLRLSEKLDFIKRRNNSLEITNTDVGSLAHTLLSVHTGQFLKALEITDYSLCL